MNITKIPSDDLKKSFLLNEGFYCGSIFDFLNSNEIEHLKDEIERVKKYSIEERDTELYCRYNYHLINNEITGINENDNFIHSIKLSEIAKRDLFVKENNRDVLQKWLEFDGFDEKLKNSFMKISEKILSFFYPSIDVDYNQTPHFTLYEDGHFIAEHNDGENIGRICGLIIYLSDEKDYNDGGGELVVKTNSNKVYSIKPIFGTFSLLDFTQNNIRHSVNAVKNGFKRYSFLYFFNEIPKKYSKKTKLI